MSRIVDEHYFTYSALTSGIRVKCPKCHGPGVVTGDKGSACFRCLSCGHQMARNRMVYRYDVHNVACPYCGAIMSGKCRGRRRNIPSMAQRSGMERNPGSAWNCGF